jgi:hypothetical protein
MIVVQGQPGQKHKTLFKNKLKQKRTGDIPQVAECKVLSSIPYKSEKEKNTNKPRVETSQG